MRDFRRRLLQAKTCFVWLLVLGPTTGAALGAARPSGSPDGAPKDQLNHKETQGAGDTSGDVDNASNTIPGEDMKASSTSLTYKVAKRSVDDDDGSQVDDPSFEGYMQTMQYDPMMAWGKKKRNREDEYNSNGPIPRDYSENTEDNYVDHLVRVARDPQDSYMESVSHPYNAFHIFKKALSRYPAFNRHARRFIDNSPSDFRDGTLNYGIDNDLRIRRKRDTGKMEKEKTNTQNLANEKQGLKILLNNGLLRNKDRLYLLNKRRFGMDASGFHGDTFNDGWGTFSTMRKRRPEWDSSGFHGDIFSGGFGSFDTMKKRRPEMDASGFYGDTFKGGFGDFYTMKRRPEMTSSGFHGDTFSNGFGDFYTMKKRSLDSGEPPSAIRLKREVAKRRPEMTSSGFHGDTFSNGFGDFYTMKRNEKRRPEMTSSGFYGDTFSNGFGDFYTMKKNQQKRRPEMTSSGFYGDTFSNGFGDFYTMKREAQKRRPEMTSSGFHGDTFSNGFGDFYTMKRNQEKRRPEMTSSGFHGDTFSNGFGDFYTMKRRLEHHNSRPSMLDDTPKSSGKDKNDTKNAAQNKLNKELKPEDMKR